MGFDREEAKSFLSAREREEKENQEVQRKAVLQRALAILREEFQNSLTEVYLVGSILRPYAFSPRSDVDIVLKNYQGDRLDLWTKLETRIGRTVELIPFETCSFQEFVLKEGFKVL